MVTACKDPNSSDSTTVDKGTVVQGANLAEKLQWVASNAASNKTYILEVSVDEFLNPHVLSYSGKSNVSVQLTGIGGVKTIELYGSGSLFTIESGVTLVLNKNITLKGRANNANNTAPLVIVNGGNLILNSGSKITGNRISSSGSGVYISSGTFTMNGGEISGNTSSSSGGGGVYVGNGTFTMTGGEISGNTSYYSSNSDGGGGGVYVGGGTFTMTGGEISGNTASNSSNSGGGGVCVNSGTFTMKGGKISGNTSGSNSSYSSSLGGGVYVGGGIFTMTGGEISGNTAYSSGGGVYIGTASNLKFEKTGGVITGYSSDTENGNVANWGRGQAVYAGHSDSRFIRYKETTSGPQNNLTYIRDEPKPPAISRGWDYTVNFANGGSPYPEQQYIADGGKIIEPPAMSRTGYTFDGWYKEEDFLNLWNFNIDTVTENITLYAQWIIMPIPDAPGTPVITPSNGSLTVQWTAVQYAEYYEVWMGTTDNSANAQQILWRVSETSYTLTDLTNGTTYYVWLKARNYTGVSDFSPMASGKPIEDMGAITLVSGNGQLVISWSSVVGADQYEVYRNTSNSMPASPVQTVSTTTATISGLANGTTYYVWVKGKNTSGTGNASTAVSGKPIGNMGAVTVTPGESGHLVVSWSAVAGADQYEVYQSATNTIPASPTQSVTTATTTTISSLANGTTYYVWVKPKNAHGVGGTSTVVSGVPIATPGNLTLNAANQQITVSWATVPGASSYQIYYRNTTTIPASPSDTVTDLNRTFTGLTNGTTYYFWVKAVNANGTSAASPMASGKPIGNMGTVTLVSGNGQLVLSWATVAGADQYEVYHSATNTIPGSPGQTVSATTTATISGLTNGTTYYVWVKPKNANGTGNTSTAISGVPIEAPGNLTLSGANQQITVSWAAVSGANSYEVYYSATTTIPASSTYTVTGLSRTITGLTNGTTYHFWVKAINANGTSVASPMASGKPVGNMGTVTLVSGNGQLVVSWSAVLGADQYEVYHSATNTIPGSPEQTVSATTTATISGLTNGTTYYVWVKPKNANGSGNVSTVTSGKPLGTPGVPTVSPAYKQLLVTWTAVPGADEYEVYYGTGTTPTTLATTITGNTAAITGLTNGTTYYVRLRAKNTNGISDYGPNASNSPSVTPGLYRGAERIGNQNLNTSLSYISSNAVSGDDFYIVFGADEFASPTNLSYSSKVVRITLIGYGGERTITLASNGSMFTINTGVSLTLDENITLVGLSTNTSSLVGLSSGNLVINAGAKISGNNNSSTSTASGSGGAIRISGGTVTMNGGSIHENTANYSGGGIYISSGTFIMNGGVISGNTAINSGGGIIISGGTVTMHDGTISGNTATNSGGGIDVSGGTFVINGGKISGNKAVTWHGGGIIVGNSATVTMYGGIISGNTAQMNGGGIYVNGTFIKLPSGGGQNSGIIYGNEETGVDAGGVTLKNTAGSNGHAVATSSVRRNTTAGQTDQIDTTTGRGLSSSGNSPYGQ